MFFSSFLYRCHLLDQLCEGYPLTDYPVAQDRSRGRRRDRGERNERHERNRPPEVGHPQV